MPITIIESRLATPEERAIFDHKDRLKLLRNTGWNKRQIRRETIADKKQRQTLLKLVQGGKHD